MQYTTHHAALNTMSLNIQQFAGERNG